MRPITVSVGPLSVASATSVRTASAVTAPGPVAMNGAAVSGGVATFAAPVKISVTTTADNHGKFVYLAGVDRVGNVAGETIHLGAAGAYLSTLDYIKLKSASVSAALTGNLSMGNDDGSLSPIVRFDDWGLPGVAIQVNVNGTVDYTLEQTLDDPNSPTDPVPVSAMTWLPSSDPAVVAATTAQQSNYNFAPLYARVKLNSGTGVVTATFSQTGTPPK